MGNKVKIRTLSNWSIGITIALAALCVAISDEIDAALDELTEELGTRQAQAADTFTAVFRGIVLCSLLLAGMMLFACLFMWTWIVKPLISYDDSIQHGEISPIYGAGELANLANTYNRIYRENEGRKLLLRQEAERDPLTGLLNCGSFDRILILYEKNRSDFSLILIDVDIFKSVNDTYGHAVGDAILKKVASLLLTAFRTIDYVCRIGGDEFAVIMVDMTSDLSYTIVDKISEVNRHLFACVSFLRVKKKADLPERYFVLTLGLSEPLASDRAAVKTEPYPGRWTTHFVISDTADLDDELFEWVAQAYAFAQHK